MVVFRNLILVLILAAFFSTTAMADTGIPWVGSISPANIDEASIFVLPNGTGPALTGALLFGAYVIDASIEVQLIDYNGAPIANFPWEDIWLDAESDTEFHCYLGGFGGFAADSSTDFNGITTFATSLAGGGWSENRFWVYLIGSRALYPVDFEHPQVPLRFNSADINADGLVNLSDVAIFAGDYFGVYHYRSDFWWDGVLNLQDLVRMTTGYGSNCE